MFAKSRPMIVLTVAALLPLALAIAPPLMGDAATGVLSAPLATGELAAQSQAVGSQAVGSQAASEAKLAPVIEEFRALIEGDPELYILFTQMFEQVPDQPGFQNDPTGAPQLRDYQDMLVKLDAILTQAPTFNQTGLVGFPINALLDWPMGTPAGASAFLNEKVNRQLKKILNQWAVFLGSPESAAVLNDDPESGWFGRDAQQAMPTFVEDFICDPALPHYGFSSWDDFFPRRFREGRRPVAAPADDSVIANACESAPYRLATGVQLRDRFWIKSQPYSLAHIFGDAKLAETFAGGTVYQAFLSALSYHRWHSPVSGTIVDTRLLDGSYYAEALSVGFDPAGPNESQGYLPQVAARALVLIEADNPDIGLMAAVFVGMAEVSSNEITVYPGQRVAKGDQLGMFHFGGSTHLLLFRPGVKLAFDLRGQEPGLEAENIPVRAKLATVGAE
jgi:phosphatidylserine decarboxylase